MEHREPSPAPRRRDTTEPSRTTVRRPRYRRQAVRFAMVASVMPAIYQRARPARFDEVVGQDHVTGLLVAALRRDAIGHAYLFSGPRGVGKTTSARLLAMAVNCDAAADERPCGRCTACLAVQSGGHPDVIELDAASNNSVDDVRELREQVRLAPLRGGRRVWILDEAHMLSRAAANALLKTLEEPPPGLLFVLATTEPEKLPATVLSRCQHFRFRRLSDDEIRGKLQRLVREADRSADEDALALLARAADGAMRDAESMLERLVAERTSELQEALVQRDTMLQEIHHRVGNSLQLLSSFISLQQDEVEDEQRQILKETELRVHAIADVHATLYSQHQLSHLPLAMYAGDLISDMQIAYRSEADITASISADIEAHIDFAISFGVILNELVTNAAKHGGAPAQRSRVEVELDDSGRILRLVVRDHGAGFDAAGGTGVGTEVVEQLVQQNKGEIVRRSDSGAVVVVSFPHEAVVRDRPLRVGQTAHSAGTPVPARST